MRKILTIAAREYRAMVATKAFVFSIVMMPLLMFGGMLAMELLEDTGRIEEKKIVIVDGTGQLYGSLEAAAEANNRLLGNPQSHTEKKGPPSMAKGVRYLLETVEGEVVDDHLRLELSDRIRRRDLYAFVEIPEGVIDVSPGGSPPSVGFYSQDSGLSDARRWVQQVLNESIRNIRLERSGLDPQVVSRASAPVQVRGLGLLTQTSEGGIAPAQEKNELQAIFLPLIAMMLMFMVIFLAAQPSLEGVLEEKSQRIAEVLLGSANPSQLMTGKLLGTVGGSLTAFAVYLVGAYLLAESKGWTDSVPFHIVPWFVLFQIFGVMFYASIFLAVGSAVSQLKEAQSMLLPVWMLLMSPMFIWFYAVREPNGPLATWFSLFPPAVPTMMILRMATGSTLPLWQPVLGLLVLIASTAICVYLAGRIFRVGILWQGKTPKVTEILRWALKG
jgi:ABC-type Na+ efflux pump permease subunit